MNDVEAKARFLAMCDGQDPDETVVELSTKKAIGILGYAGPFVDEDGEEMEWSEEELRAEFPAWHNYVGVLDEENNYD